MSRSHRHLRMLAPSIGYRLSSGTAQQPSTGAQDLVARLLERKPSRRLGMGPGGTDDVRRHKWFDALDWDALHARKLEPPRKPRDDSAKRLKDLVVRFVGSLACLMFV